jgi:alpha-aminoadipate carrier protein LysW
MKALMEVDTLTEKVVLTNDEKMQCYDCDTEFEVPKNVVIGEIVTCYGCGLEFEVKQIKSDFVTLEELVVEGEDWGE